MTDPQTRDARALAAFFAGMALVGVLALPAGALFHGRFLLGLAVGCLPTGVLGFLGASLAPHIAAARRRS